MELAFTKVGDRYVASFTATGNFNIHLEKPTGGTLGTIFKQSSVEGAKSDGIKGLYLTPQERVLDTSVIVPIPPMYITIESDVLPTMAVVTAGEGAEVGYSEAQISDTLNTPV